MNNKPFINYHIKACHNSYIYSNYQINLLIMIKNIFEIKNIPTKNDKTLNNHLIII